MNPRKRKGLLFMVTALVIALGTFVLVARYVSEVNRKVGEIVTVYQAKKPIEAYVPLSQENLEPVEVPRRWVPDSQILTTTELAGRRIGFRVNPGTRINRDMLVARSDLSSTERELAINVNAVTGVAGRVKTGDRVDVLAVFGDVPGLPKQVRVLERGVRIVSIAGEKTVRKKDKKGLDEAKVIPVTLALEPKAALAISYAAAFAEEVRLIALPNEIGVNREREVDDFDASDLGGKAIPEGEK